MFRKSYLRLRRDRGRLIGGRIGIDGRVAILALRGQVPGTKPALQVIDIGGEGLAKAAERNGGAVCRRAAILAALANLGCLRVTYAPRTSLDTVPPRS